MRNRRGFTLVEVMMAVALLAMAVGGIMGVLVQNTSTGISMDYTYAATNIAKSRIERLREVRRDRGYDELTRTDALDNYVWAETSVAVDRHGSGDTSGDFERTTIIDAASYGDNLARVTVKVKYKLRSTLVPAPVELVTNISRYYE